MQKQTNYFLAQTAWASPFKPAPYKGDTDYRKAVTDWVKMAAADGSGFASFKRRLLTSQTTNRLKNCCGRITFSAVIDRTHVASLLCWFSLSLQERAKTGFRHFRKAFYNADIGYYCVCVRYTERPQKAVVSRSPCNNYYQFLLIT